VKNNDEKLGKTLANTQIITKNLSKISDSLVDINFAATFKNLETTVESLNKIIGSTERGEGSLGKLMKDEEMYNNLTNASKELEELLRDMKLHPKRFVHFSLFGKKGGNYEPEVELKN